jgi:uncharacterized coiled-coil DUF342 family protein
MNVFNVLFDWLIPPSLRQDDALYGKAKNLVGLAVVAVLAAPPFAGLYAWLGNTSGAIAITLALPALAIGLLSMRVLGTLGVAQYLSMSTLFVLFCSLIYTLGGDCTSSVNAWFAAVPVVATFMLGLRQGLLWLGMCTAAMLGMVWASTTGAVAFPVNPVKDMPLLNIISNLGLVPFVAGLALFFQLAKDQSDATRRSQVETIRFMMDEVGAQTRQVSDQVQHMVQALDEQSQQAVAMRAASDANQALASSLQQTSTVLADEASHARETAEQGAEVVGSAIANTEALAESINRADELVRTMQSRSQDIGGIVDRIKGLAFQTNILALNATIEAAHAGAQGRGFAVVADNVRKLAGEAGEAATAISAELGVVLQHIQDTARLLDSSQTMAASGRESAARAKEALQSIQDSVRTLHGEMDRLREVSHRQLDQNGELQSVASRMEAGIQRVAGGSSTIEQAMVQLNARLDNVNV